MPEDERGDGQSNALGTTEKEKETEKKTKLNSNRS
jgi:hypothetical protein